MKLSHAFGRRFASLDLLVAVVVLAFIAASAPVAHAAGTRYAKPSATGAGSCGSWNDACTLQTALTSATSGDEIWVAAGTHKPTTNPAVREATFQLENGVALYGGFLGIASETQRTDRNPATHVTILSGDVNGDDGANFANNSENVRHVVTGATGATLDGFTITAGNADNSVDRPSSEDRGGGMYNLGSSPTLTNVIFSANSAFYVGGGLYNESGSNPALTNVTFSGNRTTVLDGASGGMHNYDSSTTLTNVTFSGNSAVSGCGGMGNVVNSSPILENVTFSGNSAAYGGGMLNVLGSNPTLTNVTFSGNTAVSGGGIYNDASSPQIRNTIFWGNTATSDGAQIHNVSSSGPSVTDSVVQGGCPAGSACLNIIDADPKLGTLGNYGGSTQTIPLLPGSSAIDVTNTNCPPTDQRGVSRPQPAGGFCDIGAFESELDTDGDGVGDGSDQCPGTPPNTPVDAQGCPTAGPTLVPTLSEWGMLILAGLLAGYGAWTSQRRRMAA